MLTLMAMSFSILWSVSTGPFFIYLLYLFIYLYYNHFSPKRRYILCSKKFDFLVKTWTRIKLNQLSKMLLGSFSEKKNVFKVKKLLFFFFFSKTTVSIEQVQISFYPCFLGKYIQNFMWYSRLTKMQK